MGRNQESRGRGVHRGPAGDAEARDGEQSLYRALQAFFGWCVRESEIEQSPMETMRPPSVPETPVPVLSDDQLRALLESCEGKTFEDRRDMAMIRLLLETGMRRGELAGMSIVDVDFRVGGRPG